MLTQEEKDKLLAKNTILAIIGKSGTGKTTLVRELQRNDFDNNFKEVVSTVSRPKREGEREGIDYYFVSPQEFDEMIANDEFAEYIKKYEGLGYGVSKAELENIVASGSIPLVIIDTFGRDVLKSLGYNVIDIEIYLEPEDLKQRLIERGDKPEAIKIRLEEDAKNPIDCKYQIEGYSVNFPQVYSILKEDLNQ